MKISVVTVCYNAAATVEQTLKSVLSQDYPDIEYIVVDGASTDGTQAIVERYKDRLSAYISEPDKGIYDAMNKGIALATGEVVGLLNADDIYAHRGVLSLVAVAMQASSVDAVYGDVDFFDDADPSRVCRRYRSARFRPDRIAWGWMPAHPSLFLRRSVYQRFGVFRTQYRIAGDFELIARIFKDGTLRSRYLPEVMVRMRAGGVSNGGWRKMLLLNREVMQACRDNGIHTNWLMLLSKYPLKLLELLRA